MNGLKIIRNNGQLVTDSRDVAEMTEERHDNLIRRIENYISVLNKGENSILRNGLKSASTDFFILSEYESGKPSRKYPCYLLTRKGCDMVANKMTGEKGVLFTAAYVTKFEEMERNAPSDSYMISDPIERAKRWIQEQEDKKLLQAENKLLSQQNLTWANRKVLEAIITAYGASINIPEINGFREAWRDFKKELLYAHSINLNARISKWMESSGKKTKPNTLAMIHDEELTRCISTAVALCKIHGVDISEIINKHEKA
ncbi:phage regulatory protein Rha [Ruminiclostridium hungatei]|uniref:Phage regulatory protein Rha n=1 Tax=Ruminiclostridium hungatei TaxID=48256 RepID=A0A1V4SSQ8_RUMHU|nr:Rha family transcriptional regulator [Ruminiclostridium hungatei]OPX46331.1 phage regulatory protein Rha [Ruminiclostridium hungatei]